MTAFNKQLLPFDQLCGAGSIVWLICSHLTTSFQIGRSLMFCLGRKAFVLLFLAKGGRDNM